MSRASLIVVDDDPDIRMLIRVVVGGDSRLEVTGEAVSAEEAIALAGSVSPQLIVLDHSLEGATTGLRAAPALKAAAPEAKILLFTAYDMSADVQREPAVDGFLRKDEVNKLVPAIAALLGLDPVA